MNTTQTAEILSHDTWNHMIDKVTRIIPIRCVSTHKEWSHPWLVSVDWNVDHGWVYSINCGFVNGLEPESETIIGLVSEYTRARIKKETGKYPSTTEPIKALLTESPRMAIGSSRVIGKGADPVSSSVSDSGKIKIRYEAVPEFFSQFGVTAEELIGEKSNPRILRAVDVVLRIDRLTAKLDVMEGNGFLDSYNAIYFITYGRNSPARVRPQIESMAKHVPKSAVDLGSFNQSLSDDDTDDLKIATIYFLSSPGETSLVINNSWQPFVSHDVFWNLRHAPATLPHPLVFEPLRLVSNLSGGIADPLFASILSTNNDAFSEALALATQSNLSGRFWSL